MVKKALALLMLTIGIGLIIAYFLYVWENSHVFPIEQALISSAAIFTQLGIGFLLLKNG